MALLEVSQLRVWLPTQRGPVEAVRGLDFSLQRGETLGLVGESGCGKSISAMALMGLLPDKGKFSLYEWHNAYLEVGIQWQGMKAQAWSFISMAKDGITAELPPNPIASELRAISLGKHAAPAFGPVLIAVKQ